MGLTLSFFRFTKIVHLHPPWPGSNPHGRSSHCRAVCGRPLLRSAHTLPAAVLHGCTAWGFRTCYNLWEDYGSHASSFFSFLDYFSVFIFHVNSRFSSSSSRGKAIYCATHSHTPSLPLLQNCSRKFQSSHISHSLLDFSAALCSADSLLPMRLHVLSASPATHLHCISRAGS